MNTPPRALLWDIDGTLIDTTRLIVASLDHIYRVFLNRTLPPDELRAIIGTPLSAQIRIFGEPEQFGADAVEMEAEFIRYYEAHRDQERIIDEAVAALIAGKKAGRPTALVTSKNRAEIANTLPRLGIRPYVDLIVSAEDVERPKPDPACVRMAVERLGVTPHHALFIGDTVHDMRAGREAGVVRCAVMWGASPRPLLLAEQPEYICEYPRDLPALLGIPAILPECEIC